MSRFERPLPEATPMRQGHHWKTLPLGLLGMVGMILLVEGSLSRRRVELVPPPTLSWLLSERATTEACRDSDVLCLGDSLIKHGLLPREIEQNAGLSAFNLAVSAAQAPTTFYLLDHALKRGARPKAIVVGYSPDLLMGSPRESLRNYPEILSAGELVELARAERDFGFATRALLARWFPSVRARFEIRGWIVDALTSEQSPSTSVTTAMLMRNWQLNRGAQFTSDRPEYRGEVSDADAERLNARRFWCHRLNRRYIERTLARAEKESIRVVWVIPPVAPRLQGIRRDSGADAKHTAFLESFLAAHPRLVIVDARESGFPNEMFVDPIHLTGRGALTLSRGVAKVLSDPSRVGWTRLEADFNAGTIQDYESLHESEVAVRTMRKLVR